MKIKGILIKNSYNCFWGQSQGGHPETKSHPRNGGDENVSSYCDSYYTLNVSNCQGLLKLYPLLFAGALRHPETLNTAIGIIPRSLNL